jgi:pimeloyl-ACP methyl ester carboxylesterase
LTLPLTLLAALRSVGLVLAAATLSAAAQGHEFLPCDDANSSPLLAGSLCAKHTVPLDHGAKSEPLSLFIRKFPAAVTTTQPRQGEVWLLSGGPGESGATLYPFIDRLRASFAGFDIIVPDHRGTGFSTRLCVKEEAASSPGGSALLGAEWASCWQALNADAARTRHFSLSQAARDLRSLLAARPATSSGQPSTYLYAVSYGTQLALRALQMGPLPVRAVVLDSLVPPENDAQWDLSRRSIHVDDVGRQVLARCDADEACRKQLVESAALSLQRVLDRLDAGSLPSSLLDDVPGRDLKMFMGQLLDWPAARVHVPTIIRDLEESSASAIQPALAALQSAAGQFPLLPQMPASVPLSALISGSENNLRPELTVGAVRQSNSRLLFTSPVPELLTQRTLPMYPRDKFYGKPLPTTSPLPPLLVFSGSLDPKTHLEGARKHVAALRGSATVSWVQAEGASHFVMWTAPACFDAQLRRFLQAGMPPQVSCAELR